MLRISTDRLVLWAAALTLVGAFPIVLTWHVASGDLSILEAAGRAVGTHALLYPEPAYNAFVYVPAAAWFCVPLAGVPHPVAFFGNAIAMLGCAIVAALFAARIYAVSRPMALALVLAWAPVTNAIALGQNAPLGALLAMATIFGVTRGSLAWTAIPLGLLLYKPTFALPLVGVLVLRGRWRALAIVIALGAVWYAASVWATGGDAAWPARWAAMAAAYTGADFAHNVDKAVSLPGIFRRAGASWILQAGIALVVAAASIVPLRRCSPRDAASAACAIGLAISPHAWGYDAVLLLPLIFVAAVSLREPPRTWLLVALYLAAPLIDYSTFVGFDVIAIPVIAGSLAWIAAGYSTTAGWERA